MYYYVFFPQGQLYSVGLHKIVTKFHSLRIKQSVFLQHLHQMPLFACEMSNSTEQFLWLSHKTGLQVCYCVKKQSFTTTSSEMCHTNCWDQTWNHQGELQATYFTDKYPDPETLCLHSCTKQSVWLTPDDIFNRTCFLICMYL